MVEYGRIHTDGSRSGGRPVQSDAERVARALAQADGIEICSDATYALSSYGHKAQAALSALRQPTQSSVAAAPADRIGGAGGLPCGVVGVATQSDADLLEEMRFTYETVCSEGYNDTDYTEDLDFEIEARGWEAAFAVAVAKLRQPTQSDAVQSEIEALRHDLERQMTIANEQVNEFERLREALKRIQHFSPAYMWRAPDIKVIIGAALQEQSK